MNDKNADKVMELWKSVNVTDSPITKQLQLEIVNQIASALAQYYFWFSILEIYSLIMLIPT